MKKRTRIIAALIALAAASGYGFVRVCYPSARPVADPNYCCTPDLALPANLPAIQKPAQPKN